MPKDVLILIVESIAVYILVLWTHSLRHRFGLAHFYALLGGITAIMSFLTDAGVVVQAAGLSFLVGSTVFYTALLLGVFMVYVFDGPRATRTAISTVAGVSILVPVVSVVLHLQGELASVAAISPVPAPSLRINAASVLATVADFLFLAIAWETLGKWRSRLTVALRSFLTLLGVLWLDVLLFSSLAFLGSDEYVGILQGTLLSRLAIALVAWPLLYAYLELQNKRAGIPIEHRPVLSILREMTQARLALSLAQQEIERRRKAEKEREAVIEELQDTLARVHKLEGLLPACSGCGRVRVDSPTQEANPTWISLEDYLCSKTTLQFSHGICSECVHRLYPDMAEDIVFRSSEPPPQ